MSNWTLATGPPTRTRVDQFIWSVARDLITNDMTTVGAAPDIFRIISERYNREVVPKELSARKALEQALMLSTNAQLSNEEKQNILLEITRYSVSDYPCFAQPSIPTPTTESSEDVEEVREGEEEADERATERAEDDAGNLITELGAIWEKLEKAMNRGAPSREKMEELLKVGTKISALRSTPTTENLERITTEPTPMETLERPMGEPTPMETLEQTMGEPNATETLERNMAQPIATESLERNMAQTTATESLERIVVEPAPTENLERTMAKPTATKTLERTLAQPTATETLERNMAAPTPTKTLDQIMAVPAPTETLERNMAQPIATESVDQIMAEPIAAHLSHDGSAPIFEGGNREAVLETEGEAFVRTAENSRGEHQSSSDGSSMLISQAPSDRVENIEESEDEENEQEEQGTEDVVNEETETNQATARARRGNRGGRGRGRWGRRRRGGNRRVGQETEGEEVEQATQNRGVRRAPRGGRGGRGGGRSGRGGKRRRASPTDNVDLDSDDGAGPSSSSAVPAKRPRKAIGVYREESEGDIERYQMDGEQFRESQGDIDGVELDDDEPGPSSYSARRRTTVGRTRQIPMTQEQKNTVKRAGITYILARGLESVSKTRDGPPEEKEKIERFVKILIGGEPDKFLSYEIPTETKLPDEDDYRRTKEYLLKETCTLIHAPQEWEEQPSGQVRPTSMPAFRPFGPLMISHEASAEEVLRTASLFAETGENRCWQPTEVRHPVPDGGLVQEERVLAESLGETQMAGLEGDDSHRLAVPCITLKNPSDIHSEAVGKILNGAPICVLKNIDSALQLDKEKMTVGAVVDIAPSAPIEVLLQPPQRLSENRYWGYYQKGFVDDGWTAKQIELKGKVIETYVKHWNEQRNLAEEFYEKALQCENLEELIVEFEAALSEKERNDGLKVRSGKEDWTSIKFGTNIDLPVEYKNVIDELMEKLPSDLKVDAADNILIMMGEFAFGINIPQMYIKDAGSRTCAHYENALLGSINYNYGPGRCVWYAVPYEYTEKVIGIVEAAGCNLNALNYWPNEVQMLAAEIPLMKFNQEAGDLVYVNSGTFHWVQAEGACANYSWNVGRMTFMQLAISWISYSHNLETGNRCVVPMQKMAWAIARHNEVKDAEVYQLVRNILIISISYQKMWMDVINNGGAQMGAFEQYRLSVQSSCHQCSSECFNVKCVVTKSDTKHRLAKPQSEEDKKKCENLSELNAKGWKKNDVYTLCAGCSENLVASIHLEHRRKVYVMERSIDELSEVYDNFVLQTD